MPVPRSMLALAVSLMSFLGVLPDLAPESTSKPQVAWAAERGRVRIINNAVVADNGTPLRGGHISESFPGKYDHLSFWTKMRDNYRLNAVRLTISTRGANNIARTLGRIDLAVEMAAKVGMYVILDNHASCCGAYSRELNERFWKQAAPRYKHRTHVLYEIQNEPVAWRAEQYKAADVRFQVDMYRLVRNLAPQTHIILWSFAKTSPGMLAKVQQAPQIDYRNASVGVHPYGTNLPPLDQLWRKYPVIITEFAHCCSAKIPAIWDYVNKEGLSWLFLDLNNGGNWGDGVLHPQHWPVNWPPDPYYRGKNQTRASSENVTRAVSVPSHGSVDLLLEAEDGRLTAPMTIVEDATARGGAFIEVPEGHGWRGGAEYTFHIRKSGLYVIWGRVMASHGGSNSFFVTVDDGTRLTWALPPTGKTWVWDRVHALGEAEAEFFLESGEHTLVIAQREDGTRLDRLLITDDLDFVPGGEEGG